MAEVDVLRLDAAQIAAACASRSLDPGDVVAAFQRRIAEHNPALNAVVGATPPDLAQDIAQLRQRIQRGETLPLAGVPVVVKDVIWVRGQRVTRVRCCSTTSSRRRTRWQSNACGTPAR